MLPLMQVARSPLSSLARMPLLRGVPEHERQRLLAVGEWVELASGATLFRAGEPADHAVLVVEGRLRAWVSDGESERAVGDIFAGEIVGEAGIYGAATHRTASVRAQSDTKCLRVTRAGLEQMGGTETLAALQRNMLAAMARRLRSTGHAIRREWKAKPREPVGLSPPEPLSPDQPPAAPEANRGIWGRLSRLLGELT